MRRLALSTAFVLCASWTHAQETAGTPGEHPIAESADRIARDIWPTDAPSFSTDEEGRPRFQSGVTETLPPPAWRLTRDFTVTPGRGAISHEEMVRMMTPMEFATPLISRTVDPGSIYNDFKRAWREWQARRIHERVVRELEELERLRAEEELK
jgi:hypothetical protein